LADVGAATTVGIDLSKAMQKLPELANRDETLVRRGRYVSVDFLIEIGDTPHHVSVKEGLVVSVNTGAQLMRSWSFAIRGNEQAWRQFWRRLPPPGFHDVFALTKRGEFRIEGDLYPFMANLLYFKRLLAAPRGLEETR
jgi:hypothetical protein